jgi:hypothetical protein
MNALSSVVSRILCPKDRRNEFGLGVSVAVAVAPKLGGKALLKPGIVGGLIGVSAKVVAKINVCGSLASPRHPGIFLECGIVELHEKRGMDTLPLGQMFQYLSCLTFR